MSIDQGDRYHARGGGPQKRQLGLVVDRDQLRRYNLVVKPDRYPISTEDRSPGRSPPAQERHGLTGDPFVPAQRAEPFQRGGLQSHSARIDSEGS